MFIEEYLQDLRRERFKPRAFVQYVRRTAGRVREDLVTNPSAVRSVWSVGLVFFALAFLGAGAMALGHDRHVAQEFFLNTALWILFAFTVVTLHLGLLRNRDGYRLSSLNVPTVLTLLRVSLIPGIALLLGERHFTAALVLYLVAAATDVLDGWLARRCNQITRLGTVMDPIVDIIFNLCMAGGLMAAGMIPAWVFALAALRYGILLVGGACLYLFVGPVRIRPTHFGRMTGVVMATLVGMLVALSVARGELASHLAPLTEIALGALFGLTVAHSLVLGWYNVRVMTGEAQARGRVVGDVRWDAS